MNNSSKTVIGKYSYRFRDGEWVGSFDSRIEALNAAIEAVNADPKILNGFKEFATRRNEKCSLVDTLSPDIGKSFWAFFEVEMDNSRFDYCVATDQSDSDGSEARADFCARVVAMLTEWQVANGIQVMSPSSVVFHNIDDWIRLPDDEPMTVIPKFIPHRRHR